MTNGGRRLAVTCAAVTAAWLAAASVDVRHADAQNAPIVDSRFAGVEWTFVRIRYSSWNSDGFRARYWSDPWAIDGPAAEQNLSRRLRERHRRPGERSDRADPRGSRALEASLDLLRRAGQPDG